MATLVFPSLEVLQHSLASGIVPASLAQSPVQYDIDEDGVRIRPSAALPKSVITALGKLGVRQTADAMSFINVAPCWPALLPLQIEATSAGAVLFDLPDSRML